MIYNILLIEDEAKISDFIKAYLDSSAYNTKIAKDGQEGIDIFMKYKDTIHLIILDLMMPKIKGEEVCKIIRKHSDIPIIILTAKTNEIDKIIGLSIGADDYITKPFSPKELMLRIDILIRRIYGDAKDILFNDGTLLIDEKSIIITKFDENIELTSNEFNVLTTLVKNCNQVLTRQQIIDLTFGINYDRYDRTIDTYIKNIRHKIEDNSKNPDYIETIYGVGYRFKK